VFGELAPFVAYVVWALVIALVVVIALPAALPVYIVIAVIGGALVLRSVLREHVNSVRAARRPSGVVAGPYELARAAEAKARLEPWYADVAVDLAAVWRAWAIKHPNPERPPGRDDPAAAVSPYYLLPLPKLIEWGFATPERVREATNWASSTWFPHLCETPLWEMLRLMGWSDSEACARIILVAWSRGSSEPRPATDRGRRG